jgi:lysophospholipase L1-like esterase
MKNVILLGDSIRIGYCNYVKEELKDIAEVVFPDDNSRFTQYTFVNLFSWLALVDNPEDIDVIHWNNGLWDVVHFNGDDLPLNTTEEYANTLRRICRKMKEKAPNAKIIFATMTPINEDWIQGPNYRIQNEVIKYNGIASDVMKEQGIEVNDLFKLLDEQLESYFIDQCHLKPEGYQLVARQVSSVIKKALL